MKKSDWYTLFTNQGSKIYIHLANGRDGKPLLPPDPNREIEFVDRGFSFKAFWLADRRGWAPMTRVVPVRMIDHLPSSQITKDQLYGFIERYATGLLGPRNLHLELRATHGEDEVWIHPRYLAEFWTRVFYAELRRERKHHKLGAASAL
jgi:hypothetical protein